MTTKHPHVGRPSLIHSALEWRSVLEAATLPYALPWLLRVPKGDGQPVLLLPGFMASEVTMICLQGFLRNRGYDVSHWGFGRNVGFQPKHAKAVEQKIRYIHHTTGRKVSLVGWSLGGIFAMYGARQAPECVRSVITLGSPIGMDAKGERNVPRLLKAMYRLVAHPMGSVVHENQPAGKVLMTQSPLTMPLSCLYGVGDGVVPPKRPPSMVTRRCTKTFVYPPATSAWRSIRWCFGSWPTGSRSPRGTGSLFHRTACRGGRTGC